MPTYYAAVCLELSNPNLDLNWKFANRLVAPVLENVHTNISFFFYAVYALILFVS